MRIEEKKTALSLIYFHLWLVNMFSCSSLRHANHYMHNRDLVYPKESFVASKTAIFCFTQAKTRTRQNYNPNLTALATLVYSRQCFGEHKIANMLGYLMFRWWTAHRRRLCWSHHRQYETTCFPASRGPCNGHWRNCLCGLRWPRSRR